ncbi:uncharacterized protein UTRI_05527_B [Ustilago trichophora]|uniref:Uncharacterized protein n=1 Tax=Ustilago trichophora TaxID=86804 RepID=A0A5C3ENR1_9BASI|nr:uncharacterized protein UTRI_05527_B [Ustilago trichophora]
MVVTRQKTTRGHLADTRPSSSSAKGAALTLQSDENAPRARRVLGDIKNNVGDQKAMVEASRSSRKPLSDRNAPIPHQPKVTSNKATQMTSRPGPSAITPSTRPRRQAARPAKEPKLAGARSPKSAMPRQVSHVEIPAFSSSPADSLSAQIEAAELHSKNKKAAPSHAELIRISPDIDSDDLEYFDVSTVQPIQAQPAASNKAKGHQGSSSKHGDTDAEATASHGSSDKENVPPPTARPGAGAGNRQSARTRAGVLREQPTHSTPISQKRQATQDELPSAGQILNDNFDFDSDRSGQLESPGVARWAKPLTASSQQLLDYQDRGVSKVEDWKAAGHHAAHREHSDSPTAKSDDGSIDGLWLAGDQSSGTGADAKPRMDDFDVEDSDEFGFFLADRKIQDRHKHALVGSFEYEEGDLENTSDLFVDIATEPFNTSDDRRLAEHAFGRMSSPAIRHEGSSVTAEDAPVVRLGDHKLHAARKEQSQSDTETEAEAEPGTRPVKQKREEEDANTSAQRVTRSHTKRKSDVITIVEESDDTLSPVTTSPLSIRKHTRQASKSKRTVSGIPLKRNETKEQKMLEMLAAEASSSPANSSAPSSPRATRTRKKAADSPAAKKLAQDKLLSFLPSRKRNTNSKNSGSKGKKATSTTSRKGGAASTSKAKAASTKGRSTKTKSPSPEVEIVEDDNEDESESDEAPKRRTRASAQKGKGKSRAANDEDWRNGVNSSPIHSDDSDRTKRLKEMRAVEDYSMEYELVLG